MIFEGGRNHDDPGIATRQRYSRYADTVVNVIAAGLLALVIVGFAL